MNDSRPEDVLCVCLGGIDGISDAMLLGDDGPSLGDLWALIPRDAWDLKTRGTLAIRIEAAYHNRVAKILCPLSRPPAQGTLRGGLDQLPSAACKGQ
jgi:hypothetical protein